MFGLPLICRPFLLPCLAVGSVSFVAFASSLIVMKETLPKKVASKYAALDPEAQEEDSLQDESRNGSSSSLADTLRSRASGICLKIVPFKSPTALENYYISRIWKRLRI